MKSAGFLLYSVICPTFADNATQIITNANQQLELTYNGTVMNKLMIF